MLSFVTRRRVGRRSINLQGVLAGLLGEGKIFLAHMALCDLYWDANPQGVSSMDFHPGLGIRQLAAWRFEYRIRTAFLPLGSLASSANASCKKT